jgi:hypothetical protein
VSVPPRHARVADGFRDVLDRYGDELDDSRDLAWGLDAGLRLAYLNRGWYAAIERAQTHTAMARWTIGAPALDAIAGPQRAFYEAAFANVVLTGQPWQHRYLCPTPAAERTFWMRVDPVGAGRLLVVSGLAVQAPPSDIAAARARDRAAYVDARGVVVQCGSCRRVRRPDDPSRWDWVGSYVADPPDGTSHGVCPACLGLYYPP